METQDCKVDQVALPKSSYVVQERFIELYGLFPAFSLDPSRKVHAVKRLSASPASVPHRSAPDLDGLSRTACGFTDKVIELKLILNPEPHKPL